MSARDLRTLFAALLLVVGALAGCTSSPSSGPSSAPLTSAPSTDSTGASTPTSGTATSTGPSTTASPSAPSSSPSSPSPSPPVAVGPVRCHAAQVSARFVPGGAGAGQRAATLVLQNTSGLPCTLRGYAGMQLVRAAGSVPTQMQRVDQPGPTSITLRPGQVASALLRWSAVPGNGDATSGTCQPVASSAWVTPPDARRHTIARWGLGPVCEQGRIQEFALVAGIPPT